MCWRGNDCLPRWAPLLIISPALLTPALLNGPEAVRPTSHNWIDFMHENENKSMFHGIIKNVWKKNYLAKKYKEKTIYLTIRDECYKYYVQNNNIVENIDDWNTVVPHVILERNKSF